MEKVVGTYEGGLKVVLDARGLTFRADQTLEGGGENTGPMPSELLAGALAACMGMDVAYYCNKVGLDPTAMRVETELESSDDKPYRAKSIRVRMTLPNAELGKRRDAVIRVAESCYVHNSLASDVSVALSIVGKDSADE